MKVLLWDRGRRVDGLGDAVPDAMFAHTTVGAFVEAACLLGGLAPVKVPLDGLLPPDLGDRVVVLPADLFITSTLLAAFVRAAASQPGGARLALRKTPSVEFGLPLQGLSVEPLEDAQRQTAPAGRLAARERAATHKVLFDAFVVPAGVVVGRNGDALWEHLRAVTRPVLVDKREMVFDVRLPLLPMQGDTAPTLAFPVTSSVAMHLKSWVHVLWLNQLAAGILINTALRQRKLITILRILAGLSFRREKVLQALSVIHPTARIHPTAYVEASIIGPNAVVGARASVRQSVVSAGAEVGDHSTVLSSAVGTGAYVTPKTFMLLCCIHPNAVVGNQKLQVSLIGRGAHINAWAGFIDAKFQGGIKVELDGTLQDTQRSFLGSCVGHGAHVPSKVLIHPGRVIPAGAVVVMRPDEVISTIPEDLPPGVPMVRDEGTLRPVSALKKPRAAAG